MQTTKPRRAPVVERLIAELEKKIQNQEFSAHAILPSIRTLAATHAVSPRTAESALRQMCQQGLLTHIPGRGFKIPEHPPVSNTRRIAIFHQEHGTRDPRPQITAAIAQRLSHYGYLWDTFDLRMQQPEISFLKKNYAAVIFSRQLHNAPYLKQIADADIPRVTAGRETDLNEPASYVDRKKLIRATVHTLHNMGHRRIALIVRSETDYFYPGMITAYRATLAELGLDTNQNPIAVMQQNFELGAYLVCRDLLHSPNPPTAIIASRDYQACGIHQACIAHNLLPGKDISLISYDDIGWPGGRQFLTTYAEPCQELGFAAVDILHAILIGKNEPLHREITPELKLRRTLCPIPPLEMNSQNKAFPAKNI